jgi:hypothetical protein
VLRLHRLDLGAGDRYRIAFLQGQRFVVIDDVVVSRSAIVPAEQCRGAATGSEAECFDVAVTQLTDYVARVSRFVIEEF